MDDSQHVDLILHDAINYAIGVFDQLADVFSLILGDFPAEKRLCGDLLRASGYSIHHPFGISSRVKGNVFINVCQMPDGI